MRISQLLLVGLLLIPVLARAELRIERSLFASGTAQTSTTERCFGAALGEVLAGQVTVDAFVLTSGFWAPYTCAAYVDVPVGITPAPAVFMLEQNRPNPVVVSTTIAFRNPGRGRVQLDVFDLSGRRVRDLIDRTLAAGPHVVTWDLAGRTGTRVAPGVYMYRLVAGGKQLARKLVVIQR
jgi:hypothetical protein